MDRTGIDLLQGTLGVLILKGLSFGPKHGYGLARWIEETATNDLLTHKAGLQSGPIVWLDAFTGDITEDRYYALLEKIRPDPAAATSAAGGRKSSSARTVRSRGRE